MAADLNRSGKASGRRNRSRSSSMTNALAWKGSRKASERTKYGSVDLGTSGMDFWGWGAGAGLGESQVPFWPGRASGRSVARKGHFVFVGRRGFGKLIQSYILDGVFINYLSRTHNQTNRIRNLDRQKSKSGAIGESEILCGTCLVAGSRCIVGDETLLCIAS